MVSQGLSDIRPFGENKDGSLMSLTDFEESPVVLYVDDDTNNLNVLKALLSHKFNIKTFASPVQALEKVVELNPAIVVCDQRMPEMSGVKALEFVKKMVPHAIRIIVTGYSDEELVIQSVRSAQVFDYIKKPWAPTDLEKCLDRAVQHYRVLTEADRLFREVEERNNQLEIITNSLERSEQRERELRQELECWVPPFILWALSKKAKKASFPSKHRLVVINYDLVKSSNLHGVEIDHKPVRSHVMRLFTEAIFKNYGWRESHAGDSSYGHFGLMNEKMNLCELAFATAREFRVALRSLADIHNLDLECGIGLHVAQNAVLDIHVANVRTADGHHVQKSFDTYSTEIDLLHHMEKLVHYLPGSNIIMTKEFVDGLSRPRDEITCVGAWKNSPTGYPIELHCLLSDKVKPSDLEEFRSFLNQGQFKTRPILKAA